MRDTHKMIGMAALVVVIGLVVFFFGPSSIRADFFNAFSLIGIHTTGPVEFKVLGQGTNAYSIHDRINYEISSEKNLAVLWGLVYGSEGAPAIPRVDFGRDEVLAVFDGAHQTAGYQIEVRSVDATGGQRLANIAHVTMDSHCTPEKKSTSPFQIIEVPKTLMPLTHQDVTATSSCQ